MENQARREGVERRVAIIGGGAAGLTAANALRERGYARVTVFERADHVGGKCRSVAIDGRPYELGAGILAENNAEALRLARKFDVPLARVRFGRSVTVDAETGERVGGKAERPRGREAARKLSGIAMHAVALAWEAFVRYPALAFRYPSIRRIGFEKAEPELAVPFAEFAARHGITRLAKAMEPYFTGFGYDYFDRVPAAYALKYFGFDTVMAFVRRRVYTVPAGIQTLWEAVARGMDVRLNARVVAIERGETIAVQTQDAREEFDLLVIASPLDETAQYLDVSEEERALFSRIRTVDYRTVACSVSGLGTGDGYVPANFVANRPGEPVFWHHRHDDTDVFTFYALADAAQSDDHVVARVRALVTKMDGDLSHVHSVSRWKYFPHVSPEDMRAGFYRDLEALQGARGTYYVGELFNFSTVGLTSEYAADLVRTRL